MYIYMFTKYFLCMFFLFISYILSEMHCLILCVYDSMQFTKTKTFIALKLGGKRHKKTLICFF